MPFTSICADPWLGSPRTAWRSKKEHLLNAVFEWVPFRRLSNTQIHLPSVQLVRFVYFFLVFDGVDVT
jgi:hypothetical protein